MSDPEQIAHKHGAFGSDRFGQMAKRAPRYFGTPQKQLTEEVARLTHAIHELLAGSDRRQTAP